MKKCIVFGAGLSGLGAKELLEKKGFEVYLIDDKIGMSSKEGINSINSEEIEFIVKSPGISWKSELLLEAMSKGIKIISEIDLAYKYMDKNIKIIGITGTNGKTTTVTKIYELLEFAGFKTALAGNAGYSFAKLVADEIELEYIVLELSSYQLENNPKIHPFISGNINLTPDHLMRYTGIDDYYITKFNIFNNQDEEDYMLLNLDDREFQRISALLEKEGKLNNKPKKIGLSKNTKGTVFVFKNKICIMKKIDEKIEQFIFDYEEIDENEKKLNEIVCDKSDKLMDIEELSLKGNHNLENVLFIIGTGKILNISNDKIRDFLKTTKALEHRLENFFLKQKTLFINDSKGTNVESTVKAIEAFKNKIILIAGGEDKKICNDELIKKIKERVFFVYLIGETATLLSRDLDNIGYSNYKNLETLENVILDIKESIDFEENQTVLFSPATASFDQFKNFEERGRIFKELTNKILGEI